MSKTKIALWVFIILLIIGAGGFYYIYRMFTFVEDTSGPKESIPTKASTSLIAVQSGNDDWPSWKGARYDNTSLTKGIKTDWKKGLKLRWRVDYLCQGKKSATWSAPVIKGRHLIVPGRSDDEDIIFCIDAKTGKLFWKSSYKAKAETSYGPGSRATPYIDGKFVYTFGRSGDLVCWNMYDGKKIWHERVSKYGGVAPRWGFSSAPYIYKNLVIVQGKGRHGIAFDKTSGKVVWQSEKNGMAGYAAPIVITIQGKDQLLMFHGTGLASLEPLTGKELWNVNWETNYGVNATTPYICKNHVFISSSYNMGSQLFEITTTGAKSIWKNNAIEAHHTDPIVIDGYLYCYSGGSYSNRGKFVCIELKTGKEAWKTRKIGNGTTIYVDGYLLCLDYKGNLFLVKADPKKFEKIASFKGAIADVKAKSWTMPVVSDGRLYLRYRQHLLCYDLK